jgi:hypothetical protein
VATGQAIDAEEARVTSYRLAKIAALSPGQRAALRAAAEGFNVSVFETSFAQALANRDPKALLEQVCDGAQPHREIR